MVNEHERLLPVANVGRIMKQILPPRTKISKEAKETMQECASEFISFVTAEASEKCHKENRKTINGDDICWSLSSLGFDIYTEVMLRYLRKYREQERQKAVNQSYKALNDEDEASNSNKASATDSDNSCLQLEKQPDETPITFEFSVLEKDRSSRTNPAN